MTIHPTKTCFDDALLFIVQTVLVNPNHKKEVYDTLLVVHGICLLENGRPYAHAWVENPIDNIAIFRGIVDGKPEFFSTEKAYFYEQFEVQEYTLYTIQQAMDESVIHPEAPGGPWKKEYLALTREYMNAAKSSNYGNKNLTPVNP